jgi:hypothetical protein
MSSIEVKIDETFTGPGIKQLAEMIDEIPLDHEIVVNWSNTRAEIALLKQYPDRKFLLIVDDFTDKDRTMAALGLPLSFPQPLLQKAANVLIEQKLYDWRNFVDDMKTGGAHSPKWILVKLVADSLRKGRTPVLADIVSALLHDGIRQEDVDVLLRLKGSHGS